MIYNIFFHTIKEFYKLIRSYLAIIISPIKSKKIINITMTTYNYNFLFIFLLFIIYYYLSYYYLEYSEVLSLCSYTCLYDPMKKRVERKKRHGPSFSHFLTRPPILKKYKVLITKKDTHIKKFNKFYAIYNEFVTKDLDYELYLIRNASCLGFYHAIEFDYFFEVFCVIEIIYPGHHKPARIRKNLFFQFMYETEDFFKNDCFQNIFEINRFFDKVETLIMTQEILVFGNDKLKKFIIKFYKDYCELLDSLYFIYL
jgi:hypothetical protein